MINQVNHSEDKVCSHSTKENHQKVGEPLRGSQIKQDTNVNERGIKTPKMKIQKRVVSIRLEGTFFYEYSV